MENLNDVWVTPEMIEDTDMKIIDIRLPFEWEQTGIVAGSHTLTFFDAMGRFNVPKFTEELDKIVEKEEKFALICRTGSRTGQVAALLREKLGYNAVSLNGGILKLIGEGYRTETYRG